MSEDFNDVPESEEIERETGYELPIDPLPLDRSGRLSSLGASRFYRRAGLSGRVLIFLILVALLIGTATGMATQNFIIGVGAAFVAFVVITTISLLIAQIWKRIRRKRTV